MFKFFISFLLVFSLFSCSSSKNESIDLYDLVPENSSYIIESENIDSLLNQVEENDILKEADVFKSLKFREIKSYTSLFTPTNSILYFIEKDSLNYDFVLLRKPENDSLVKKFHADFSIETITTDDFSYKKTTVGDSPIYSTKHNEVLFASNSLKLLKQAAKNENLKKAQSDNLKKVIAAKSKGKTSLFIHKKSSKNSIADWSVLDLEISNNELNYNGIALTNSNKEQFLNIFQGVQHQKQELIKIIPNSADGFYSLTYNDFSKISKNLQKFRKDSLVESENSILNYTKEAGALYIGNEAAVALALVDVELAMDAFPLKEEVITEFRGVEIYSASEIDFLNQFEPFLAFESPKFYMLLENFLVYSKKQEILELIISNFQNNSILYKNAAFQKIQENLADASSLLIVTKPELSKAQIESSVLINESNLVHNLGENYSLAATQFVSNDGFTHIHGVILGNSEIKNFGFEDLTTSTYPVKIIGRSYVFKNNTSEDFAIVVQDGNNLLSYLDPKGKILWKKQLATQIIGKISPVTINKNGNPYMLFATLNKLHVLDKNGNYLKGFPLEFKDNITQPPAIFDYDNRRNYRFVIVQDEELLMYDCKGNSVKGFEFVKASSEITQTPKHIRLKNKDYIVFPERSGKLNILSRQGKERIKLKEKFQFSENQWYENRNNFITISEDGKLIRIDQNGKISKQDLKSESVQLVANENALVLLSENVLTINNKELSLDFGLYSRPEIFNISGKTYASITDSQAKKVYLFDGKGELVSNFPVYGISLLTIIESNTRDKINMLVLGQSNEIISYKF